MRRKAPVHDKEYDFYLLPKKLDLEKAQRWQIPLFHYTPPTAAATKPAPSSSDKKRKTADDAVMDSPMELSCTCSHSGGSFKHNDSEYCQWLRSGSPLVASMIHGLVFVLLQGLSFKMRVSALSLMYFDGGDPSEVVGEQCFHTDYQVDPVSITSDWFPPLLAVFSFSDDYTLDVLPQWVFEKPMLKKDFELYCGMQHWSLPFGSLSLFRSLAVHRGTARTTDASDRLQFRLHVYLEDSRCPTCLSRNAKGELMTNFCEKFE
jgi:hypothetical protein